jgi:hypothetical protein
MHVIESLQHLLRIAPWPPHPDMLFWFAVTLTCAALLGAAVHSLFGLPRVLGYGAVGAAVAALGLGSTNAVAQGSDRLVLDLALAVLLFELGSRVNMRWLSANKALLATSAAESLLGFGAAFGVLRQAGFALDAALGAAPILGVAAGELIGRIAGETRSAGQVTERMLMLSALNMLYAVLLARVLIGWLFVGHQNDIVQGLLEPLYAFGGATLLALVLASVVRWVVRGFDLRDENTALLLLGLLLLAVTLARALELSPLLVPLLAGACLRNLDERPCIWPRHFGTAGAIPVVVMFVLVGATWSAPALTAGGLLALTVLGARLLVKGFVLLVTSGLAGLAVRQSLALALTQSPVSAASLVLLAELQATHPQVAAQIAPVVLAAIALMALAGPVLVVLGLRLARELP